MDEDTKKIIKFRDKRDWKQFHSQKNIALSLLLEVAEVLELFQWSKTHKLPRGKKKELEEELADVYWYLLLLAHESKIDIRKAFAAKIRKKDREYPVSKSKGTSKKYTKL